jgi:hypothetical protein
MYTSQNQRELISGYTQCGVCNAILLGNEWVWICEVYICNKLWSTVIYTELQLTYLGYILIL